MSELLCVYCSFTFNILISINCTCAHKQLTEMVFNYSALYGSIVRQEWSMRFESSTCFFFGCFILFYFVLLGVGNIKIFYLELSDQFPKMTTTKKVTHFIASESFGICVRFYFGAMSILWNVDLLLFFCNVFFFFTFLIGIHH